MRLDLAKYECAHFGVRAELKVGREVASELRSIIEETDYRTPRLVNGEANAVMVGIYGTRFRAGGLTYDAVANLVLSEVDDEPDVTIFMVNQPENESLPRPPRRVRSVSRLLQACTRLFPLADVECNADFRYPKAEGWLSTIDLPIPLVAATDLDGITHIETAVFSSRNDGGIQYRIAVNSDDEDTIGHMVFFESEVDWTQRAFRRLIIRARAISSRLLAHQGAD